MYRKIVVAIDPSGLGDAAVPIVTALARQGHAEVLAVSVRDLFGELKPPSATADRLDAAVRSLVDAGVQARGQVLTTYRQPVAGVLAEAVHSFGADLVALGSRGRGDLTGLVLGSVGHDLAARLDIPVLLVHGRPGPGAAPRRSPNRILVAIDHGEGSQGALHAAGELLREGAAVEVVHAPEATGEGASETEATAAALLEAARSQLAAPGVTVSTRVLPGAATPAAEIAAAADEWDAGLIVVGSRRLTDAGGLLMGSVAHGLVRRTHRPVLLAERVSRAAEVGAGR